MSTSEVIHPITLLSIPVEEFEREAIQEGYSNWLEYLEVLDTAMDEEGGEEEEEEEDVPMDEEKKRRIRDMREADGQQSSLSLIYSRECKTCLSSNPVCRAVLTECGHWMCLPCGETLSVEGSLTCPFCQLTSTWVRLYEESEQGSAVPFCPSIDHHCLVIHPSTGDLLPFAALRQEALHRGFIDPLAYLEYLDMLHCWSNYGNYGNERMANSETTSSENKEEKEIRIQQMREVDAKESSLSLVYSRQCRICFSPNPLSRTVLSRCGHSICLPCADTLSQEGTLTCPFCRASTPYINIIEEVKPEDTVESQS